MATPRTWKCDVCGYIHEGDAPPHECPVCGVGAELFQPFEVATATAQPTPAATSAQRRIVVVGNGVAGLTAAEAARRSDAGAHIELFGKEPELPYYRLNLTHYLAGGLAEQDLWIKTAEWYVQQRIERQRAEVERIDRTTQQLLLDDGSSRPYDRLVLATGAHAFVPPMAGTSRHGVQVCRNLADVRTLLAKAKAGTHVAVIGGGLLGLEVAGALTKRQAHVEVLEGFHTLLPRQLAEPAGVRLRSYLEAQGIAVRCGVKVEEIVGDESARGVRLGDGSGVECTLVVIAAGVRPNSHLARRAGLTVNQGVVVDDAMATSDPHIFAAGDVAEHGGRVSGLWPTAYAQGAVAGANAAGSALLYQAVPPSARLKVLDVGLFSIGVFNPPDGSYGVVERTNDSSYLRLVSRDGALVGANLFGDTALARLAQEAVESKAQLRTLPKLTAQVPELLEAHAEPTT